MGKVANFVLNVSQFDPGESTSMCMAFCAAQALKMVAPGNANITTAKDINTLADSIYASATGSLVAENIMTKQQLEETLARKGIKYTPITPTIANIDSALDRGHPLIVAGSEANFVYADNGSSPYSWNTAGIDHAIIIAGREGNAYIVCDSANAKNFLPAYDKSRMKLFYALEIAPYWRVYIEQAATDTWNSTAHLFGGTPPRYYTGIAESWRDFYINQRKLMPPPTTDEFASVNWDGKPIVAQIFGHLRCEWDGAAHWYEAKL
jgi:hypothetical protein